MTLKEIQNLGRQLSMILGLFAGCFVSAAGRRLLRVYVQGQLSDVQRKNCEAMALKFNTPPRTLQRFLESIKWNEEMLRNEVQVIIARDHGHPEAIGTIDESGIAKSGSETAGAARQYNGNRGKVENCMVGVHLGYSAAGFQTLLDSQAYLPEQWAQDAARRQKAHIPEDVEFKTKPQIALDMIDRALANGIQVSAWTFDELYGRDGKFLDGLQERGQAFVAEIPADTHVWTKRPKVLRKPPGSKQKLGRPRKTPRVTRRNPACEVRNLAKHSRVFRNTSWQRYRIKDTKKGPEVWDVKSALVWRKTGEQKLPSQQHTLIVARNVRTGEMKFFLSNQVAGRNGVTLRRLLHVAFSRWVIEACFRVAKEELGIDHFEVRGWRCIHRHYYVTALSYLICNRIRADLTKDDEARELTVEQVRRALNSYLAQYRLPHGEAALQQELNAQAYYQRRNEQARISHTKTRVQRYLAMGIDVDTIRSCIA